MGMGKPAKSPVTVVTADSHVGPSLEELRPYCDAKYLDEYDAYAANYADEANGRAKEMTHEQFRRRPDQLKRFGLDEEAVKDEYARMLTGAKYGSIYNSQSAGSYEVQTRCADMDFDGIAAEVIFHGTGDPEGRFTPMPFTTEVIPSVSDRWNARDRELVAMGRQMYNRWLADFCSIAPERHAGLCQIPVWDLDLSVEVVKWAAEHGLRGVNFPSPQPTLPTYEEEVWDEFFGVCAELGMPLVTHVGGSTLPPHYVGPAAFPIKVQEFPFTSGRNLWHMIFAGVFDRHPELKLSITEVSGTWFITQTTDMDGLYDNRRALGPVLRNYLKKRPSDYVRSNIYFGVSFMSKNEAVATVEAGLVDRVMWGSDYPHEEGTWMYYPDGDPLRMSITRVALANAFAGLSEPVVRRMAGGTAIECYGFDAEKLASTVRGIGPDIDELTTPPDLSRVPVEYFGMAFRTANVF